jgi:hypothetical protein
MFPPTACSCNRCVGACHSSPCIPTPAECEELIRQGHIKDLGVNMFPDQKSGLMYSWVGPMGERNDYGDSAGIITSTCVLLDKEKGLCTVHDSGCKPLEGRIEGCSVSHEDSFKIRSMVLSLWKSPEGIQVMDDFFRLRYGQNHLDQYPLFPAMVKSMLTGKFTLMRFVLMINQTESDKY